MAKQKAPKPEDVKIERFTRSLRVQLTPEEVADRADRAAAKLAERDDKESEQKAEAKRAKAVIEQVEAELRNLSNEVRTRSTYRNVDIERRFEYKRGRVVDIRLDTGEVIEDRPMKEYEMQKELFTTPPEEAAQPEE